MKMRKNQLRDARLLRLINALYYIVEYDVVDFLPIRRNLLFNFPVRQNTEDKEEAGVF